MKSSFEVNKLFVIILAALFYTAPLCAVNRPASAAMNGDVRIQFTFTKGERSKDSHENAYAFKIAGGRVTYNGPYGECVRGQCEHKRIVFKLTVQEVDEILSLADELGLYSAFSEIQPVDDIGSWVKASLIISHGERSGTIRVEGMVNNWVRRTSPAAPELSPRAREWLKNLEKLRQAVTAMAKKRHAKFN